MKPGDGERCQIPVPEMAVCAAHALPIGDMASERADTLISGQIGYTGRLCLAGTLQVHLCLCLLTLHQQGSSVICKLSQE